MQPTDQMSTGWSGQRRKNHDEYIYSKNGAQVIREKKRQTDRNTKKKKNQTHGLSLKSSVLHVKRLRRIQNEKGEKIKKRN